MTRGWGAIARACGSKGRHALHFKYNGATTLLFKVFGEDGGRLECCSGGSNCSGKALGGELALGHARDTSGSGETSSGESSGNDEYDEPPRCRARVKEEEDTD